MSKNQKGVTNLFLNMAGDRMHGAKAEGLTTSPVMDDMQVWSSAGSPSHLLVWQKALS